MILIDIIFAMMVPAVFVIAIWYYVALFKLSRILASDHPQALDMVRKQRSRPISNLQASYLILRGTKGATFGNYKLSPRAITACKHANRLLYIALFVFLVLLFSFLCISLTKA